jgi:hypothetical protein
LGLGEDLERERERKGVGSESGHSPLAFRVGQSLRRSFSHPRALRGACTAPASPLPRCALEFPPTDFMTSVCERKTSWPVAWSIAKRPHTGFASAPRFLRAESERERRDGERSEEGNEGK